MTPMTSPEAATPRLSRCRHHFRRAHLGGGNRYRPELVASRVDEVDLQCLRCMSAACQRRRAIAAISESFYSQMVIDDSLLAC